MRFLHVDNSMDVTGAYKALLNWCYAFPNDEHIWVIPSGSKIKDELKDVFKTYEIPFVEIGKSVNKLVKYFPALYINGAKIRKITIKERIDIIHMNDLYNITPYFMKKIEGVRYWVHVRLTKTSYLGPVYNYYKKWHLRYADRIITVSKTVRDDWEDNGRIETIYDPYFLKERLQPYSFNYQPGEKFRFLYLANYIPGKGQDDAVRAIHLLHKKKSCQFTVDFYGSTMNLEKNEVYKQSLLDYCIDHNLEEIVSFNGKHSDVEELFKSYHAALHFSHSESFCMVCYEALFYRIPLISTDCGGPSEMIVPDESGVLIPVKDIEKMAQAMEDLILRPAFCEMLSENAGNYIRKYFPSNQPLSIDVAN